MQTLKQIYQTIQSKPHGHSGRGMSYWVRAAQCGRRAILEEKYWALVVEQRAAELAESGEDDALSIGTYYHALMELKLRGQLFDEVWDQTDEALNPDFLEAVRLYRGYMHAWGGPLERWGAEFVAVEEALNVDGVTGRVDAVFQIQDTGIAYANTGLLLPAPGLYLVDWKTGKAKSERDQWDYTFGPQSINYLNLYRQAHPDRDVKGMIFDKIIRHKALRKEPEYASTGRLKGDSSFHAYLAAPLPGDEKVVENLIQIGRRNVESNEANGAHCFSQAKPCPMFSLGLCERR